MKVGWSKVGAAVLLAAVLLLAVGVLGGGVSALDELGFAAYYVTPNPFSPNFDSVDDAQGMVFTLNTSAHVIIKVKNYKGVVRTVYGGPYRKDGILYNQYLGPGLHTVGWTGTDDNGKVLPDGNYAYEIIAKNGSEVATGTGVAAIVTSTPPAVTTTTQPPSTFRVPACATTDCDCSDFGGDTEWATWFLNTHDPDNSHRLDGDGDGTACE